MRKLYNVLFVLLFVFLLSGCRCEHEWDAATCETAGICVKCGKTGDEPFGHRWEEATCTRAETCAICDKVRNDALGHDWIDASCEQPRRCLRCEETEGNALGHSPGEMIVTQEATCMETGRQECGCVVCGEKIIEEIATKEHAYGKMTVVEKATCIEEGYQEALCKTCGSRVTEILPVVEHKIGGWKTIEKATCSEDGKKAATCSVCKEVFEEIIPKTEKHQFGKWITKKEPTCTLEGISARNCKVCILEESNPIDATGHKFEEGIVEEATYYEMGTKGRVCVNCKLNDGETYKYREFCKTTFKAILDEYRKNEISADEKYDGMYIESTGKISKIESGTFSYGKIIIEVNNGTYWPDEITCKIKSSEQMEVVKRLSVGKQITIRGKIVLAYDTAFGWYLDIDIVEIK